MRMHQREHQAVYATEIASLFPVQGEWTEDDYFALPETNRIVELSDGEIIMPPMPPGDAHQKASIWLASSLLMFVDGHNLGTVRSAPLSVRLWEGKIREPDVLFVRTDHLDRIGEKYIGPPDWVAEILSPRTRKTDVVDKLKEYAQAGIPEYWMIDTKKKTVRVYVLREDEKSYTLAATYTSGQVARSETIEGFGISVDRML